METKTTTTENYTFYFIFKTNNLTGKTDLVCDGLHDDEDQASIHWQSYLYGFMDAVLELDDVRMEKGTHRRSFRVRDTKGQKDLEYFMLLNDEGQDLVYELANL